MQDIVVFAMQHWLLCALLIVLVIAVVVVELRGNVGGIISIAPSRAVYIMNRENAVVLDVRPADIFKKSHIIGSLNIPASEVTGSLAKLSNDKTRPLIVCALNQQANAIAQRLKKQGFEKLYILQGGLAAWQQEQLPVESGGK